MSLGDKMKLTKRDKILYLVTLILIIGGDQFTKHLVSSSMQLGQSQEIIDNFFILHMHKIPVWPGECLQVI